MRGFLTEHPKKYPQLDFAPLLHDVLPMRHDLSKRKAAYLQRFKNDTSLAINSANLLLSNSEHTLNEVQHFSDLGLLPPLPDRKKAIPLAHELKLPPKEHAANASSVPANFILTVGSSLGRKNMEVVLRAVESMAENANAPNLVVAGSKVSSIRNWTHKNLDKAIWPKIHFIHNPNDSMLLHLYKQASAFVLPSKDEGWGLPAGEALWHGVPVIASDIPIMRELGGARLLYFDPDSVDELSQRIDAVCNQRATSSSTFTARRPIRRGLRCWAQVAHELVEAVL
jgi:glycosyltransferase involved in cell wall biosynthesis